MNGATLSVGDHEARRLSIASLEPDAALCAGNAALGQDPTASLLHPFRQLSMLLLISDLFGKPAGVFVNLAW